MDRNHTNNLLGIVKFSAIFIAIFQGKIIFDLRSENLRLDRGLTESSMNATKILRLENNNNNQLEQIATLEKELAVSKSDLESYLSQNNNAIENQNRKINSLKEKINQLSSNKYLTGRSIESDCNLISVDEEAKLKANPIAVSNKLLTSDLFRALVMGKTRFEVSRLMGRSDEINDYYSDDGTPRSSWKYKKRIRHPGSYLSGEGSTAKIYFDNKVVDIVTFE